MLSATAPRRDQRAIAASALCTTLWLLVAGWTRPASANTRVLRATVHAAGLTVSLEVLAAPLFLGELLPVTVSLANDSPRAMHYVGPPTRLLCNSVVFVTLSGGKPGLSPVYPPCPAGFPGLQELPPGNTLRVGLLVPLTLRHGSN